MEEKIKISEDCVAENIQDDLIILNVSTGEYHELNQLGAILWKIVEEKEPSREELIIILEERFSSPDIKKDCVDFIEDMVKRNLFILN